MNNPFIDLVGVHKHYGEIDALKDITFSIEKGTFLSVFGPNGAGKSTLLKIIATQITPSKGKIYYNGKDGKHLENIFRKNLGIISHKTYLYSSLTVLDNLRFYAKLYNMKNYKKRIEYLLKKLGLYEKEFDYVKNLSRGMSQRAAIARALLHDPSIIILDEPFTGLDQSVSNLLSKILSEELKKNKIIIMATHNIDLGYKASNKLAIMRKGNLVYLDKRENISIDSFKEKYIKLVKYKDAYEKI